MFLFHKLMTSLYKFFERYKFKYVNKEIKDVYTHVRLLGKIIEKLDNKCSLIDSINIDKYEHIKLVLDKTNQKLLKMLIDFNYGFEVQPISYLQYKNAKIEQFVHFNDQYYTIKMTMIDRLNNCNRILKIKNDAELYSIVINIHDMLKYIEYELLIVDEEVLQYKISGG